MALDKITTDYCWLLPHVRIYPYHNILPAHSESHVALMHYNKLSRID